MTAEKERRRVKLLIKTEEASQREGRLTPGTPSPLPSLCLIHRFSQSVRLFHYFSSCFSRNAPLLRHTLRLLSVESKSEHSTFDDPAFLRNVLFFSPLQQEGINLDWVVSINPFSTEPKNAVVP